MKNIKRNSKNPHSNAEDVKHLQNLKACMHELDEMSEIEDNHENLSKSPVGDKTLN